MTIRTFGRNELVSSRGLLNCTIYNLLYKLYVCIFQRFPKIHPKVLLSLKERGTLPSQDFNIIIISASNLSNKILLNLYNRKRVLLQFLLE